MGQHLFWCAGREDEIRAGPAGVHRSDAVPRDPLRRRIDQIAALMSLIRGGDLSPPQTPVLKDSILPDSQQNRVPILRDVAALRATVAGWRARGETIAMTPTMGALHAGHVSLVTLARQKASRVVMSIFVNPAQFAPNEDFSAYPRTFEADVELFAAAGGDAIFAPPVEAMYPAGFATRRRSPAQPWRGSRIASGRRIFPASRRSSPSCSTSAGPMSRSLARRTSSSSASSRRSPAILTSRREIVGAPTVREKDGLALSSRNVYLSPGERKIAPALHAALVRCAAELRAGASIAKAVGAAQKSAEAAGFAVDYIEARDAESLRRSLRSALGRCGCSRRRGLAKHG